MATLTTSTGGLWEVLKVTKGPNPWYAWHVEGINHMDGGANFSWSVPSLEDPNYDLTSVKEDVAALASAHQPKGVE